MGIFKKADVSVVTEESAPKPRLAQIKRNLLSFISVSWVTPILRQGKTKPLEEQDLPELSDNDKTAASSRCLEPFWTKLKAHHANPNSVPLPCFRQHMAYIFILEFLLLFFLMGFNVFLDIIRPLLIPQVIRVILLGISPNNSTDGLITTSPYVMAFLFFGIQVLFTIVTFTTYALNLNMNIKMSSILIDAIYGKALRLSPKSRQEFSEGMINTLTTSDKTLIAQSPFGFISLIFNIVQIALALYYISRIFGYATWAAIGTYTLFTLSQLVVAPGLGAQFKAYMTNMDGLTKVLREFLYGIKIIKFQAIENAFHDKIEKLRATQLSGLRRLITMLMWLFTAVTIQQSLVPTTSIMAYAALGYPMTPEAIFGGLALFDALIIPSGSIVSHFTVVLQFGVSFKRVMSMLIAEEIQPHQQPQILSADASEDGSAITLTKSSFTWEATKENKPEADSKKSKDKKDKKDKKSKSKDGKAKGMENAAPSETTLNTDDAKSLFSLKDITLSIPRGSLVAVVGSVGSGKSSFLAALNGSMRKTDGEASIYGRIAYCAQEPWIMSGTIEENILFSDESSYPNISKAVAASCLEHDLELLPHGLGTQIGEKGVNLSGGQKARVALARAIARDADIYLLDDPIAALDAHVGKKVFDNAICDTLKEKTVILVTHQLHLLSKVDLIVLLDDGRIIETGTFKDLMAVSDGGLATLMKDYSFDEAEEEDATSKLVANPAENETVKALQDELAIAEDRAVGRVSSATLRSYFAAWGPLIVGTCCIIGIIALVGSASLRIFLALWTDDRLHLSQAEYLKYYIGIGVADGAGFCLVSIIIFVGAYRASVGIYKQALDGLIRAPMSFFDGQPVGRILNRMTTDVNAVDMSIAMPLINLMGSGVFFFSSLIVMVYSSTYQLIQFAIFSVIAYKMFDCFFTSYRELKRLSSIMRSPLAAHISETLTGVQTINGFGVQEIFVKNAQLKIDMTNKSNLIMTSTQSWLAFRLDMLSAFVTLVLLLLAAGKATDPANIGIALISALTLGAALNGLLQLISHVEASFNAVERLDYYAYQLPAEAEYLLPTDPKDKTWPSSGAIQIKNLELCYASRPNHPVIQDLTLSIAPGEKVGVVGRTGSGKSTLMLALFRILESSKGSIEVDGIDISTLGLTTLRSNMQIIPQDPVLFQGTVRSNLDILDKYTDEEIWNALSLVGLKDYISGLGEKLEDPILENGNNLSVGQRQLMCLCKAILAQPKILIMDEATASVDAEADRRIQESIEKQFQHTTILSIAHRLNTIAAFDRVLVLDQGAIVELDSPHVLLGRPESAFSGLVNATGQANAVVIREIAATHHSKKV